MFDQEFLDTYKEKLASFQQAPFTITSQHQMNMESSFDQDGNDDKKKILKSKIKDF